ncbi:MAG: Ni/Fe hydrogenase subunit alpha [Candidatus Odinarchaeota archaeon]
MAAEKIYSINPVTRIEGNAKVSLFLENGGIKEARFHVTEFKGFEKYLEGRMVHETPRLTTRACGICPVSHHLAAAKATDDLFDVEIPETAEMLRELMHMGQFIHSHALHFFFLAAPDLILGPDASPEERDLLGVFKADNNLVKNAIKMRAAGQEIIRTIGGKAIHPVSAIPGGMSYPLDPEDRDRLLKKTQEILPLTLEAMGTGRKLMNSLGEIIQLDSSAQTAYMGTVKENGDLNLYSGFLRIAGKTGNIYEQFRPSTFERYVAERTAPYTYLKFPYYKPLGMSEGIYRVGPLARINVADKVPTTQAGQFSEEFSEQFKKPAHQTFLYHLTRLIELVYANERAIELLESKEITGKHIHNPIEMKSGEGVGVVEAPRGTLIHHYKSDSDGRIQEANLIVATVQNNSGINQSIKETAESCLKKKISEEGMLSRVEMVIRAYDPCLTCASHTMGRMPLIIDIFDEAGPHRTISR